MGKKNWGILEKGEISASTRWRCYLPIVEKITWYNSGYILFWEYH